MTRVKGQQPETKVRTALDNQTIASALSSDTNGNDLDRNTDEWPRAVKFHAEAVSLGDASDDLQFKVQEKDSGGSYSDTGDTFNISNGSETNTVELDLSDNEQVIRVVLDAGNSTLASDTEVMVTAIFNGMKVIPQ